MSQYFHFIINKNSKNGIATLKKLLMELPKYSVNFKISITESIKQLENEIIFLKQNLNLKDIVVVVGGDGSLNHAVTLFKKHNLKNPIGYIPSGSGNDFARTYGISTQPKVSLDHLFTRAKHREIDLIHVCEGKECFYSINSLGIGIDGRVVYQVTTNPFKKYIGSFSYMASIISAFIKQDTFPLDLKTEHEIYHYPNAQFVLVANHPFFGGGIKIIPNADGSDGKLNILVAEDVSAKDFFKILIRLAFNQSHLNFPKLHSFLTTYGAIFTPAKQYAQKDGEIIKQNGYAYQFSIQKILFYI